MQTNRTLIVEPVAVYEETLAKPVDFAALFGNDHPVEMEIGCGKGTFITQQAEARPEVNFFGIEWAKFYWRYTCDRLRRRATAGNARCLRADAGKFVADLLADDCLDVIHIYFPDPWPKARHNKRRLIQPPFLEQVHRILKPGGRLQVVTDHLDYWQQIEQVVPASPLTVVDYQQPGSAADGEFVGTNFERKYIEEGRKFHAIAAIKQ